MGGIRRFASASVVANSNGSLHSRQLYKAWGENRWNSGTVPTTFRYTGQRQEASLGGASGLYDYGARFYDPALGRFTSPDTVVPVQSQGVQAWDRFAGMNNNPVRYNDPTGHCIFGVDTIFCVMAAAAVIGAAVGYVSQVYNNYQNGYTGSDKWTENISAIPIIGGAVLGVTAVAAAPVALTLAGDALVGTGLVTGSATIFGAGMSAYGASATVQHFYTYGTTHPVLRVDSKRFPTIGPHIKEAQKEGQPSLLTRTTNHALIDRNRAAATGGIPGVDEYPFASTYEGGVGASIRPVPWSEHRHQGLDIYNFYRKFNINDGDRFKVVVD